MPADRLNRWNDFILCLEMVIFAGLHLWAYNWNEFNWSEPEAGFLASMGDAFNMGDVAQDIRHSFQPKYDAYARGHERGRWAVAAEAEAVALARPVGDLR